MNLRSRMLIDKTFTKISMMTVIFMVLFLIVFLAPIIKGGMGAYLFTATIEHKRILFDEFNSGDKSELDNEINEASKILLPIYKVLDQYRKKIDTNISHRMEIFNYGREDSEGISEKELIVLKIKTIIKDHIKELKQQLTLETEDSKKKRINNQINFLSEYTESIVSEGRNNFLDSLDDQDVALIGEIVLLKIEEKIKKEKDRLTELLTLFRSVFGPLPWDEVSPVLRDRYGQTRWDKAKEQFNELKNIEKWVVGKKDQELIKTLVPRSTLFDGTPLKALLNNMDQELLKKALRPYFTFYSGFFTHDSRDAHFFGGIWPEILGTFYLTLGAILFSIPLGVMTAIYLVEYAGDNVFVSTIRSFIGTLAGVPSIVFGLFGLAFFLGKGTFGLGLPKGILSGSLTLALLILPTIIRTSEEGIRAVPNKYREASLGLGASKWHSIISVILPSALPGILTGIVISIGRAAGETAPIIFTAAVSMGRPVNLVRALGDGLGSFWQAINSTTPALPWNIYSLTTEHQSINRIRHVQFGMVLTLVSIVLVLNLMAIILRARVNNKLRGK